MSLNRPVPAWALVFALLPLLAGAWLATRANERYDGPRLIAIPELKQNLHAIRLAIERYSVDHGGSYPLVMQAVVDAGYMPQYPRNPYWRSAERSPELTERMHAVPPEAHEPGGFSYLPRVEVNEKGNTVIRGYTLLVYCNDATAKRLRRDNEKSRRPLPGGAESAVSWQHVLLVLSSGAAPELE